MKIRSVETFSNKSLCFVRVTTDTGIRGMGQTAPFHADINATVLAEQLAPFVIGKEIPENPGELTEAVTLTQYKHLGAHLYRALAGLDTALWDALGKEKGVPVYALLGGKKRPVPVYGSSMVRDIPETQEAERMRRLKEEKGFRAFKLHCAPPNGNNQDNWPGRTQKVIDLVRKATGDNELYLDVNGNYSVEYAISMLPFLRDHNVCILEEPCLWWEVEMTAAVRKEARNYGILVAGGEQDYMLPQWRRYISLPAVDVCQPDPCYIGGFSRALMIAEMSGKAGLKSTPHCANRSMLVMFGAHYILSTPNAYTFLEYSIEEEPWTDGVVLGMPAVENGELVLSDAPGWGVAISDEWLAKSRYSIVS